MSIEHHFKNIQIQIIKELFKAEKSIWLAVPWVTDGELLTILSLKAKVGVGVKILLLDTSINHNCLFDYGEIVNYGGSVIWMKEAKVDMLHQKFCIIDEQILITGTYNWTYKAQKNLENIDIYRNEPNSIKQYFNRYIELQKKSISKETLLLKDDQLDDELVKDLIQINQLQDEEVVTNSENFSEEKSIITIQSKLHSEIQSNNFLNQDSNKSTNKYPIFNEVNINTVDNNYCLPSTIPNSDWWNSLSPAWKKTFIVNIQHNYSTIKEINKVYWFTNAYHMPEPCEMSELLLTKILNLDILVCRCFVRELDNLEPLRKLKKLRNLNCYAAPVRDFSPISELEQLEIFVFGTSKMESLYPIQNLKKLTRLELNSVDMEEVDFRYFKELEQLKYIDCYNNRTIVNFDCISNNKSLERLKLSGTNITTLEPLYPLMNLKNLDIRNTLIRLDQVNDFSTVNPKCNISTNNLH